MKRALNLSCLAIFMFFCLPFPALAFSPVARPYLIPVANLLSNPANPAVVSGSGRVGFAYENVELKDFPKGFVTGGDGYKATFSDIKQTGNSIAVGGDFPVGEALTLSLGYRAAKVSLDREYHLKTPSSSGNVEDSIDSEYSQPVIQLVALDSRSGHRRGGRTYLRLRHERNGFSNIWFEGRTQQILVQRYLVRRNLDGYRQGFAGPGDVFRHSLSSGL